jgi:hypothetical protein
MKPEERKLYNEKYYADNKKRISEMLLAKVECPLCSRLVAHQNIERHKATKLCSSRRKAPTVSDYDVLKLEVEELKRLLTNQA